MVNVNVDPFKSLVVESKNGNVRLDEGVKIKFSTDAGELINGKLVKISGKGEKTKLQIIPKGAQKEEIWQLVVMAEGSLSVDDSVDEEDEE